MEQRWSFHVHYDLDKCINETVMHIQSCIFSHIITFRFQIRNKTCLLVIQRTVVDWYLLPWLLMKQIFKSLYSKILLQAKFWSIIFEILFHQLTKFYAVHSSIYFIPQAPTSALTSSRKDVKQLVYFQILQNTDNFSLLSDNSAVILFSKV